MTAAHFLKHGFSSPSCDRGEISSHHCLQSAHPRQAVLVIGPVSIFGATPFIIVLFASLFLFVFARQVCAGVPQISPEWKAHFTTTPVIENCVFERRSFSGKGATNLYQFRCQVNAFMIRQIKSLDDISSNNITNMGVYAGRFGSNFWAIDAGQVLKIFPDAERLMREQQDGDAALVFSGERIFSPALFYGINQLQPATVKWLSESKFTASSTSGEKYIGEVLESSQGQPTVLEWRFEKMTEPRFVLEYEYGSKLGLPYYPSEIRLFRKDGDKKELGAVYRILLLNTSPAPLEQDLFEHKRYFTRPSSYPSWQPSTYIFSNNASYAVTKNGNLRKVLPSSMIPQLDGELSKTHSRLIRPFFLSFAVLSMIGLFFIWRHANNKTKNQHK